MAEKYALFYRSKNGDRIYTADSLSDWLRKFFTTGVFEGDLQVVANDDMSVTVTNGYGNILGKVKIYDTETKFDLETASGTLNRIDNVILRRDDTERDIYLMIQTGSYANEPKAPEIVRSGAIYDLKLAEIYVAAGTIRITQSNITDCRINSEVCGYVASTVKEIDFSQMQAQFNAYFEEYKVKMNEDYTEFITNYEEMVTTFENTQAANFTTWFNNVKGQLSSDVAGNLLNLINNLQTTKAEKVMIDEEDETKGYSLCIINGALNVRREF